MSQTFVKLYFAYTILGKDFATVKSSNMRRIVSSPNNKNVINITELRDGCLLISNESRIPIEFSISREWKILAVVKYNGTVSSLFVNNNWKLNSNVDDNEWNSFYLNFISWWNFDSVPYELIYVVFCAIELCEFEFCGTLICSPTHEI